MPSERPPMGGWRRPKTTRLNLDASVHDLMVATRSTRCASITFRRSGQEYEIPGKYVHAGRPRGSSTRVVHSVGEAVHVSHPRRLGVSVSGQCSTRATWIEPEPALCDPYLPPPMPPCHRLGADRPGRLHQLYVRPHAHSALPGLPELHARWLCSGSPMTCPVAAARDQHLTHDQGCVEKP